MAQKKILLPVSRWPAWLALLVAAFLWWTAVDNLRVEWSLNEQYSYGWAVPFLCLFLAWQGWRTFEKAEISKAETLKLSLFPPFGVSAFLFLLAVFFGATRLVEEANPDWRLVGWLLAGEAVSISLLLLYLRYGFSAVRQFAFPTCFFLVAVPWPTTVEHFVVQTLTRANVGLTVEVLNWFGLAALQHGNVIETAGGIVDVDTACSGIRSLQASIMLALFFGELKRLNFSRRLTLVGISITLAFVFNALRTIVLATLTAQRGSVAMMRWHDSAGAVILVACFAGVWAIATGLERAKISISPSATGLKDEPSNLLNSPAPANLPLSRAFVLSLAAIVLLGEIGVHVWYRSAAPVSPLDWNVLLPQQNPTFKTSELPANTIRILRFTEGRSATWQNSDGTRWQFFYFRWAPGRTAVNLARNHTPEICLPAAGHKLSNIQEIERVTLGSSTVPFRSFVAGTSERPLFVFYSLWEDGAREQHSEAQSLTLSRRWDAVFQRHRNPGQRVLEIAISGARDLAHAEASLRDELPRLVHLQPR